jgi:chemotaxis response regulator CheB
LHGFTKNLSGILHLPLDSAELLLDSWGDMGTHERANMKQALNTSTRYEVRETETGEEWGVFAVTPGYHARQIGNTTCKAEAEAMVNGLTNATIQAAFAEIK